MTTVLDSDWTTVSTHLPFGSCRNRQPLAEAGDAGLAAEADQVQACDAGQRARVLGELAGDLEALVLRIGGMLAARDRFRRHGDSGNMLVDVAQRARRADEADRRDECDLLREAGRDGLLHERGEPLRLEADLKLEEARTGAHLFQRALDAVVVRRCAGILDRTEEEARRGIELAPREI